HAGDPELKLGPDQVAIDLWEKVGMPPERIVPLPSSENFWSDDGNGTIRSGGMPTFSQRSIATWSGKSRHASRADRAVAIVRELLVGRRPRAVRPRLRAVLGLGPRDGLRRAGLPARVHAVRAIPRDRQP